MPARYDFWQGDCCLLDPQPRALDESVSELARRFAAADRGMRAEIRAASDIGGIDTETLLTYSQRAAVFAIRQRRRDWLKWGLSAIAMRKIEDFRDFLPCLCLLAHAATRINANIWALFAAAAFRAEPQMARWIAAFALRWPQNRTLESFGYLEVDTEHGAGFISRDFGVNKPTMDIERLALEVAALLSSREHQVCEITVGARFPTIWLRDAGCSSQADAREALNAVAHLQARLRSADASPGTTPRVLIYLVEAAQREVVESLLNLSQRGHSAADLSLCQAEGRALCLLLDRSPRRGKEPGGIREALLRVAEDVRPLLERHARTQWRGP